MRSTSRWVTHSGIGISVVAFAALVVAFAAFGLANQALLLDFFAARRWASEVAFRRGWVVEVFAGLGLPLGSWLILDGRPWRPFVPSTAVNIIGQA